VQADTVHSPPPPGFNPTQVIASNKEEFEMEQTQTTELEQPDDCLNFRGKAYKDLTFEDMNDVEFRSIIKQARYQFLHLMLFMFDSSSFVEIAIY
jgi:hypothetical protein